LEIGSWKFEAVWSSLLHAQKMKRLHYLNEDQYLHKYIII
jgi:hypothetical protein